MLKARVGGPEFVETAMNIYMASVDVLKRVHAEMKKRGIEDKTIGVLYAYVSPDISEGRRLYHEICGYDLSLTGSVDDQGVWSRFQNNAREKALRLMWKHKTHGHLTSRESANEGAGEYPGAIIVPSVNHFLLGDNLAFIFSFSGFPPDYDEIFSYLLAESLGLTNQAQTNKTVLNHASRAMANWPFMQMRGMAI